MKTSTRGAHFLMREEGCVLHAYNDPVGFCTVGVGHLLHKSRCTTDDVAKYEGMTQTQALDLLFTDLARFEAAVNQAIHVPMHQCEFDALLSLCYNIGTGGFAGSTLVRDINAHAYADEHRAFDAWDMAGGRPILYGRREREWRIFTLGDYNDGLPYAKDPGKPKPPPDPNQRPSVIPTWAWAWAAWYLGRDKYKGHARDPRLRPKNVPAKIPAWAWTWLKRFK